LPVDIIHSQLILHQSLNRESQPAVPEPAAVALFGTTAQAVIRSCPDAFFYVGSGLTHVFSRRGVARVVFFVRPAALHTCTRLWGSGSMVTHWRLPIGFGSKLGFEGAVPAAKRKVNA